MVEDYMALFGLYLATVSARLKFVSQVFTVTTRCNMICLITVITITYIALTTTFDFLFFLTSVNSVFSQFNCSAYFKTGGAFLVGKVWVPSGVGSWWRAFSHASHLWLSGVSP